MGQAKLRGTFEQRKEAAERRDAELMKIKGEEANDCEREKRMSPSMFAWIMTGMHGI
ncbi:MAG: hypothetical protein JKY80_02065 [Mariprofundaceae bacterium]|nr:hypothetical protein [Methylophaga sp.]MBL4759626.1 hypothetical protein [Mariprofundaceae bacterium]